MIKSGNYGVLLSIIIHAIIFAMPISMIITKHFKEVELFVLDERPVMSERIKIKPKKMPEKVITKAEPHPEIKEPIEVKELDVPKIIEPTVITSNKDAIPIARPVVSSIGVPQVIKKEEPQKAEVPQPLIDVEFGSANAPRFLHREMPVYPQLARRLSKEGKVLLRLTIDENGRLLNVEVVEGADYGFTEAAIEAVKKSTFLPAKSGDKPIMSKALLPIRFSLRRD